MKFLDQAKVHVQSGAGGAGCLSFRREKFIEYGGPDGGNGGRGGDVKVVCVDGLNTLIDFRYQQHFRAKNGRPGEGRNKTGANGQDIVLRVPVGTQVFEQDNKTLICDLTEIGEEAMLARGGDGGFGNAHYKSSTNRAPRRADAGRDGELRSVWLRLKLIADAGLVGLPNAGKSTFLSVTSRARPKIADYPFTTLHPNLGVVRVDDTEFVIADIPGLIEGAHTGTGLGHRFLGHVERCRVLLHLIDGTAPDPVEAYRVVRRELKAYGGGIPDKHELVAINKIDAIDDADLRNRRRALEQEIDGPVYELSTVAGNGVREVLAGLLRHIRLEYADDRPADPQGWQP